MSRMDSVLRRLLTMAAVISVPVAGQAQNIALVPTAHVGVLEGDSTNVLGVIQDVASDGNGNFAVLDAQSQAVRLYRPSGRFIARVGRAGRGPGEFFVPVALAYDRSGYLYVLDQANQRVEVFAPVADGSRHVRSFPIDFAAWDLCTLGDRIYLLGFRAGSLIHAFTPDGRRTASFGQAERANDPYFSVSLSRGLIECMEPAHMVLFLPLLSPNVRAWGEDGRQRWRSNIPGYEPVVIRRNGRMVTYSLGPTGRHHMASSITQLDSSSALVQVGFIGTGARSAEEFEQVSSYRIYLADGRIRRVSSNTPRILYVRGGFAFAVRPSPFPSVTAYRISETGGGAR